MSAAAKSGVLPQMGAQELDSWQWHFYFSFRFPRFNLHWAQLGGIIKRARRNRNFFDTTVPTATSGNRELQPSLPTAVQSPPWPLCCVVQLLGSELQDGSVGEEPLEVIWSTPPAQAGPPTAGCPGPCPDGC